MGLLWSRKEDSNQRKQRILLCVEIEAGDVVVCLRPKAIKWNSIYSVELDDRRSLMKIVGENSDGKDATRVHLLVQNKDKDQVGLTSQWMKNRDRHLLLSNLLNKDRTSRVDNKITIFERRGRIPMHFVIVSDWVKLKSWGKTQPSERTRLERMFPKNIADIRMKLFSEMWSSSSKIGSKTRGNLYSNSLMKGPWDPVAFHQPSQVEEVGQLREWW